MNTVVVTRDEAPPVANRDGVAITPFVQIAAVMPRNPLDELAIEVNKAVVALLESEATKPAATVTLTLALERSTKIVGGIIITPEVKTKLPKVSQYGALLFSNEDGVLSTRDRKQPDMFEGPKGVE
jgi:hypothetical protein